MALTGDASFLTCVVAIDITVGRKPMHENSVNVLIVEDYYADSFYLRELLSSLSDRVSYSFKIAPSLAECRRLLQFEKTDVICLDLGLPDSDGIETLLAVIQAADLIPILVVTGLEEAATISRVRELSFNVLQKGEFDVELLHDALQKVVSSSSQRARQHHL